MIPCEVKKIFTNLSLAKTIDIVSRKVFNKNIVEKKKTRAILTELLYPCLWYVHLKVNGEFRFQFDGVAMGPPFANNL